MSKPYNLAVVIGRFQPLHNGHLALLQRAAELSQNVLVVVGSSFIAPNIKNPFTFYQRKEVLVKATEGMDASFEICGVTDDMYNDQQWVAAVQSCIDNAKLGYSSWSDKPKTVLVGHNKDASSYYLKLFPNLDYDEVSEVNTIDGTMIRNFIFGDNSNPACLKHYMPKASVDFLVEANDYGTLDIFKEEHKHIEEYKKLWANAPFPPVFVTCDAVVINAGHILLVKRRSHPGKGLWALPGGFLNPNERIVDGIIRELEEETRIKVNTKLLKASLKGTHVFDAPHRSLRGRTITHAGLIVLNMPTLPGVRGSDDAERAKWFPISEFYNMSDKMFEDHYSIGTYMINRAG